MVRLFRWTMVLALALAPALPVLAQGQQDDAALGLQASKGLQVAPKLQMHRQVNDAEMAHFLIADTIENDENDKAILTGKAEVRRLDAILKGDRIEYQRDTGQVDVYGNAVLLRDASVVRGPQLHYNIDAETGEIQAPDYWLVTGGSGTAEKADIFSHSKMRLHDMRYSACPCPDPSWYISSPKVDFDFDENEGVARNAVLYFKGVPILASPYLSFPLSKERKSGFLLPTYGGSSNAGFEFTLPYYINLAPNYDLTLSPRVMSKRGLQLGAEYRYLGRSYSGEVAGTFLPKDHLTHQKRWLFGLAHRQRFGGGFSGAVDIRRVSDDDYFRDFSTIGLNEASVDYLHSSARLNWSGFSYWSAQLRADTYQTIQDSTLGYHRRSPYNKLPELIVRGSRYNWNGFDLDSYNTATRFRMPHYHDPFYPPSLNSTYARNYPYQSYDGTRFTSYNTVAYPIVRAGWYITPKAGVHLSQYTTNWNGFTLGPGIDGHRASTPHTQTRSLPILSLDTGLTFERETTLFGNPSIQTLEPRAYYLYVPYHDQTSIPVFDTGLATFNYSQAFSENIFSGGWDRIANANQLTLGLTTRWLDENTGFERMSLSVAQRQYFSDQRVVLPGGKPRLHKRSDYLVGATAALTDTFTIRFDAQFNPESRDRNRISSGLMWRPKRLAMLGLNYRYERDPRQLINPAIVNTQGYVDRSKEQVSVTTQWPLSKKLYLMGRFDYSLQEKRSTQSIFGLEYSGDCCWTGRVVFQRYAVAAKDSNTAVFFQLELGGLGSLGTDPLSMLRRSISGYQPVTPTLMDATTYERYE